MALRAFSSITTSTVLLTTTVAISTRGKAQILTIQKSTSIHFASSLAEAQAQEVFSSSVDVDNELSDRAKGEKIWNDIEPLFGLWADEEMDDHWLDNLRSGWDTRLRNLYDFESDN